MFFNARNQRESDDKAKLSQFALWENVKKEKQQQIRKSMKKKEEKKRVSSVKKWKIKIIPRTVEWQFENGAVFRKCSSNLFRSEKELAALIIWRNIQRLAHVFNVNNHLFSDGTVEPQGHRENITLFSSSAFSSSVIISIALLCFMQTPNPTSFDP